MKILGFLLKNKLRYYRKIICKRAPLLGALLVFILLVAGEILSVTEETELSPVVITLIYNMLLILIAVRRILLLKYPPFYFSLPGLYFFFTTPVDHRLVLTVKLLLSYFPLLIISLGVSLLTEHLQVNLFSGGHLFFYLVTMTNISWVFYNANSKRRYFWQFFTFFAVLVLVFIKVTYLFWTISAVVSFLPAINLIDEINWSKYEKHCKLVYLTRKYLLAGDWGGLEVLMYEHKEKPAKFGIFTPVYTTGYKAFTYGQVLTLSRYPLFSWVIFLSQCIISTLMLQSGAFFYIWGGSLFLLLGFASLFSLPIQKTMQKINEGFLISGGFKDFMMGTLVLPVTVSFVALIIIFLIVQPNLSPIWYPVLSLFFAVVLSYLVVVKGVFQSILSGWFLTGGLLYGLSLFFIRTALYEGALLVLFLFIPYLIFSWRRMKGIYEGN